MYSKSALNNEIKTIIVAPHNEADTGSSRL